MSHAPATDSVPSRAPLPPLTHKHGVVQDDTDMFRFVEETRDVAILVAQVDTERAACDMM